MSSSSFTDSLRAADSVDDNFISVIILGRHVMPESATTSVDSIEEAGEPKWTCPSLNEDLVVREHSVLWYESGVLRRKFGFPEDKVKHAIFTYFEDPAPSIPSESSSSTAADGSRRKRGKSYGQLSISSSSTIKLKRKRAIVIFLDEFAHIFFLSGARYVVNIPFSVQSAFATDRGLLLEREVSDEILSRDDFKADILMGSSQATDDVLMQSSLIPRFFTLTDPMTDVGLGFRSSAGSSVNSFSGFSSTEELLFVSNHSPQGAQHVLLAATLDKLSRTINVYQFKYLPIEGTVPSRRRTMSRRRSSILHSIVEDTNMSTADSKSPLANNRTATSRTDTSLTIDRMGAAAIDAAETVNGNMFAGFAAPMFSWWYDIESLRKEIEFSHVESFPIRIDNDTDDVKALHVVDYDSKIQALGILQSSDSTLMILFFSLEGHFLRFEDSVKISARDAVAINTEYDDLSGMRHSNILILSTEGYLYLYNPFLRLYSPRLDFKEYGTTLKYAIGNRVSVQLVDGSLKRIEVIQSPSSIYVAKALQVVQALLDPYQQEILNFQFSVALTRLKRSSHVTSHEWDALTVALFTSWLSSDFVLDNLPLSNGQIEASDAWNQMLLGMKSDSSDSLCQSQAWFSKIMEKDSSISSCGFTELLSVAVNIKQHFSRENIPTDWGRSRAFIFAALHLLCEELKLDIAAVTARSRVENALGQLVRWMGYSEEWKQTYTRWNLRYDEVVRCPQEPILRSPPNIFAKLYDILCATGADVLKFADFTSITDLYNTLHTGKPTPKRLQAILPKSKFILEVFTTLMTAPTDHVYRDVIEKLLTSSSVSPKSSKGRALMNEIERFPESIVMVFKEAIISCLEDTPIDWSTDALELIGRHDLKRLVELGNGMTTTEIGRNATAREKPRDMSLIVQSAMSEADSLGPWDGVSEMDRANVSRLIFREDRRVQEVQKLLQTTRMQSGKLELNQLSGSFNEADMHAAQQELARMIGTRTLAVPVGRGALLFSARIPLLTERFPIPKMNFNIMMKPSMATITVEKHLMSEANISWGLFHNGVASGLSVSRDAKEITGSWIVFNKPQELNSQHAGFLLGLGLNGHLKHLAEWHIYNYLRPKHTLISIALLLGMSISYLGTMNSKMTKVLSVHVVALLPAGSADLNISGPMQTAGIMGVGILYFGSRQRRMSEILINEIDQYNASGVVSAGSLGRARGSTGNSQRPSTSDGSGVSSAAEGGEVLRDEGYLLAAGFALGLINIGSGSDVASLSDLHLMDRLLAIGTGNTGNNGGMGHNFGGAIAGGGVAGGASAQKHHLLDKSAAGCIMALLLIYLKTEDQGVADKIDVPETQMLFEYVRPDLLLLRILTSRLIMWSTIGNTLDWIKSSIRPFLRDRADLKNVTTLDSDDIPLLNIVCGLCFSMGIRYAGTADKGAKKTLLYYLDEYIRLSSLPASTHDERMTKSAARTNQDVLALSCAIIMAGTGDLDVLRRLRRLHGTVDSTLTYGSHLAVHLAIGFLILGGGEYSLDTMTSSIPLDETVNIPDKGLLAIAGLVISLYPQFPHDVQDNQVHLQAFRHMWTFACRRRCLVVRDIETMRPVETKILVGQKLNNEVRQLSLKAPCLLPPLETISWLRTAPDEPCWPVVLDIENNEAHKRALRDSLTVYTLRRAAYDRWHGDGSLEFSGVLKGVRDSATLNRASNTESSSTSKISAVQKLLEVGLQNDMERSERALVVPDDVYTRRLQIQSTSVDITCTMARLIESPSSTSDLWNIRVALFGLSRWAMSTSINGSNRGKPLVFIPQETIEKLKVGIWKMRQESSSLASSLVASS
ncbi:hypothetical protein V1511DRAFT_514433 [Dipodascopsis uninucleata]